MTTKSAAAVIESVDISRLTELERKETLRAAQALCQRLEKPIETVLRVAWKEPTLLSTLRVFNDLKIFELLGTSEGPSSPATLAAATKADPALLARLLRHVAAMGYIKEVGPDRYEPTEFARGMMDPTVCDGISFIYDATVPALAKLPEFLMKNNYVDPHDPKNSPWTFGHQTSDNMFQWMKSHPNVGGAFNNHMRGYAQALSPWLEFFPFRERVSDVYKAGEGDEKSVLIVDVGGSVGHDMMKLQAAYGPLPGRVVLQDLPQVVDAITELDGSIEKMAHDFFTEQPVKGAHAYYFHSILHNWADADVLRILEAIKPALVRGRSKLLINDYVLRDTGADSLGTSLDIGMMAMLQSEERTEQHWKTLFEKVGFKIVTVFRSKSGEGQALLEAELAD